jgi:stringent starvation protein B
MSSQSPSSTKAYLVRAIHEWCVDNSLTPYIVVKVDANTRVPPQHIRDGQIVLNIAPYATGGLQISNEAVTCQARFGGVAQSLHVPISQILAIYARENGQGMAFSEGVYTGSGMEMGGVISLDEVSQKGPDTATIVSDDQPPKPPVPPSGGKGSHLRRVK